MHTLLKFQWIKQHLRRRTFLGISANAVKTQIRIAVSHCVSVAILTKRLQLDPSRCQILQVRGVTLFEKVLFDRPLTIPSPKNKWGVISNQLSLCDL